MFPAGLPEPVRVFVPTPVKVILRIPELAPRLNHRPAFLVAKHRRLAEVIPVVDRADSGADVRVRVVIIPAIGFATSERTSQVLRGRIRIAIRASESRLRGVAFPFPGLLGVAPDFRTLGPPTPSAPTAVDRASGQVTGLGFVTGAGTGFTPDGFH